MAQAYEVYAEACFWLEMADRGVRLDRTPGTGQLNQKRPDFVHAHPAGHVYFEVKALEIADPSTRHNQIAYDALDSTADLDRKSTRLNSSHQIISYAVFCLKKKKARPRRRTREHA